MAFPSAQGYGNLPNGNFSPVIYSKKVQKTFRNTSVVEDITNTDYMGEIAQFGDSVRIIKEPEVTVSDYKRGTTVAAQDLSDADFSLVVDQANYFMFKVDDIEAAHSHVNFMDLATDRAAFRLRDTFDSEVLGYLAGFEKDANGLWVRRTTVNGTKADASAGNDELLASNKLDITDFGGSDLGEETEITSIPVAAGGGADGVTSPLAILNRIARQMDQANVDTADRWFVADPVFYEILMDEDSKFVNADFGGGEEIRNGRVGEGLIRGFRVYKSNNLPFIGTGAGTTAAAGSEEDFGIIVAGHMSSVATAQQLAKTESYRDPNSFADIVRGMQLYGRKILRPEALFTAAYNVA
jgi:uncharacterized Zn ribbon protein